MACPRARAVLHRRASTRYDGNRARAADNAGTGARDRATLRFVRGAVPAGSHANRGSGKGGDGDAYAEREPCPKYHSERLEAIRLTTTPADAASVATAVARISAALRHARWSVTEGERQTNANGGIGNALLMFKPSSPPISGFVIGSVRGIALVWAETHDGPASATGAAVTPAMAPNASASRTAAADTPALPTPTIHLPKLTSRPGYIMGRAVFENGAQSPTSRWKEMPTAPRVTPSALP